MHAKCAQICGLHNYMYRRTTLIVLSFLTVFNIHEVEATMTKASNTSYEDWIPKWTLHLTRTDNTIRVPPTAAAITTSLITQSWLSLLANHPNKKLTEFFITGISQGFLMPHSYP